MAAIRDTFFIECEEQLAEVEAGLQAMENGEADQETVNAVFRAVHSIKGGAGAFRLEALVRFAHTFESTLDQVRDGRRASTPALMSVMLRAADILADLVRCARDGAPHDQARADDVIARLAAPDAAAPAPAPAAVPPPAVEETIDFAPQQIEGLDFTPIRLAIFEEGDGESNEAAPTPVWRIELRPRKELYRNGNEALFLLRELQRLGKLEVACDESRLPALAELDPEDAYFGWRCRLETSEPREKIEEVFEFVESDCELTVEPDVLLNIGAAPPLPETPTLTAPSAQPITTPQAATPAKSVDVETAQARGGDHDPVAPIAAAPATIRVDLDRVDRLINLVGELVINQAMLAQSVAQTEAARAPGVSSGLDDLEQLTREIQEGVMAIRAQPVKPLFQRMSRILREVADATGKSVRLRTEGESVEVDRTVIERLADPLTHMVRNAVDHGLETAEKRSACGKTPQGEVRLSAAHRSGRVVIEISDDGAGIDRARVREIAVRKGLISADAQLSDVDVDNLLFMPGFSTSEKISDISGRGVGMDVVKRSIQALGGRISIASTPGRGSTFSFSLPLTLAVLDGMVVRVADQTLVVPLTAIVEMMKPQPGLVHSLGLGGCVLANRDTFLPMIDVGQALGFRDCGASAASGVLIVVENSDGERAALMVDEIQDQRQVVIKSLEQNYSAVPGVAAATILGDGRIALILDMDAVTSAAGELPDSYFDPTHLAMGATA
jgi:two-component system chemotaxis sensor kinase CheA